MGLDQSSLFLATLTGHQNGRVYSKVVPCQIVERDDVAQTCRGLHTPSPL
jgi:hypothetical protein